MNIIDRFTFEFNKHQWITPCIAIDMEIGEVYLMFLCFSLEFDYASRPAPKEE